MVWADARALRLLTRVWLVAVVLAPSARGLFGDDEHAPAPEGPPPVVACNRGRHDYVASLRNPNTNTHMCGGLLVAPHWVLTSARCLDTSSSVTAVPVPEVHMGGTFLDGPFDEVRTPRRVVFHDKYHSAALSPYNVALLYIDPPIFSICPPQLDVSKLEVGEVLQSVGWGRRSANGPFAQSLTSILDLTTIECEEGGEDDSGGGLQEGMGCVEVTLQDICTGAGGGPMLRQGTDELVGVAIEGEGCQGVDKVSFFAPLSKFKDWLLENIDS